MKILALISLLIFLSACGETTADKGFVVRSESTADIVGGTLVKKSSLNAVSVVMITMDSPDGSSFICTGTFISDNLILTAAHCVNEDIGAMGLLFGLAPFSSQDYVSLPVARVHLNNSDTTEDTGRNDIALIEFSGGLPEGAAIAQLPNTTSIFPEILSFRALGYGKTHGQETEDAADLVGSGALRVVELLTKNFKSQSAEFSLSQRQGKGVCFGDSGGPAMITTATGENMVMGVASGVYSDIDTNEYNRNFDACRKNSIYMNVKAFLPWIHSILSQTALPIQSATK